MTAVIQRVNSAAVTADGAEAGRIGKGLLVLLGVFAEDTDEDARLLASKIAKLRIFSDGEGKQNLSVGEVGGQVLAVSNFTLCAAYRHGNRPDYMAAAKKDKAEPLYRLFAEEIGKLLGKETEKGVFGAHMELELRCDGPITIVMDSCVLKQPKKER